ncbi:LPO_1073/Vpar_1526 family protein [Clostridium perfringens]|uniref:LPO_1073/Vpar_1526 family protein n=1 Tax=Clostridium perfringens TaxID=1502 RepID=UPI0008A6B720|nr:LPO_1073/Vpar_1526 family protein [Clostridium perfringens]AOY53364.1 hypothetical protein FORC25_0946 [Clostridium perfringens]MDK0680001.1 hypothetical protein [Clostridium perfringens]MDK0856469.1 hypothetical protein [Clostridium perfringens]UUW66921.1 hypothetical protein NQ197_04885 [Clostridium perfringens]HAT4254963.1 hypothetical protein [Clostridium perfringens]
MLNGQRIDSGDNSTNIQGKEVTIINNSGLSYSDVKDIAMSVFKSNFYDLGENVEKIVQERAEKILDDYLEKLNLKNPEYIKNTEDPDIRYAIYEAQKNYARRGEQISKKLLVETLVNRTVIKDNPIQELVLNEALEIIPKITDKHITILTLIFLSKYLNYAIDYPTYKFSYLNSIIRDRLIIDNNSYSLFQHLEYVSCLNLSIGSVNYTYLIQNKFPQIKNEEKSKSVISDDKELSLMLDMWDNSKLCNSSLTSVGIAIAVANIKAKTGIDYDLGIWIRE